MHQIYSYSISLNVPAIPPTRPHWRYHTFILFSVFVSSDYLSSAILPVNLFTFFFAPQMATP